MHQYYVVVEGVSVAVYDNKYNAARHAMQYSLGHDGANVVVEYRYVSA
jgi:hypothetical protein